MNWFFVVASAVLVLTGCGTPEQNAIWTAEKAVASMLKDPDSAKFSDSFFNKSNDDGAYTSGHVCGHVNGKNSFGAYAGSKRFVVKTFFGNGVLDVSNPVIDDGRQDYAIGTRETIFEKVYWNPSCVPGYKDESSTTQVSDRSSGIEWAVQVASESSIKEAESIREKILGQGFPAYILSLNGMHRIFSGPYKNRQEAFDVMSKISAEFGLKGFVLIYKNEEASR
jgi:hypothetical protein